MTRQRIILTILLAAWLAWPTAALGERPGYPKSARPGVDRGPTEIYFFVFVLDIDDIDGAAQNFAANVYIRLRWMDERLAGTSHEARTIPLAEVWNPRILLANQQGLVRPSLPEVVRIYPDGTVMYHQRFVGLLSQPLKLTEFPRDRHDFAIQFVAAGYRLDDVTFIPDTAEGRDVKGGDIAQRLSLPDWEIVSHKAWARPYQPVAGLAAAGFAFEFKAQRYFLYYLWQIIIPMAVIVGMSWAAFWIDPSQAGAQIGMAGSSILALVAYRFVLSNLVPRLPYMTRMDYFTLGSTLLVFFALVEVIVTTSLARKKYARLARWLDRCARVAFPTAFVVVFLFSIVL